MKLTKRVSIIVTMLAIAFVTLFANVATADAAPKGYKFKYKGATVYMHGKADKLIQKLDVEGKRSKSCAYKGEDVVYKGEDITLKTYTNKKGGTEYVMYIEFKNDSVKTDKGIKIGSTEKQMLKKYGRKKDNFGVYTYDKGKMSINFTVEDGKVTAIEYVAATK